MAISEDLQIVLRAQDQTHAAFKSLNTNLNNLKTTAIQVGSAIVSALAIREVISTTEQWAVGIQRIQAVSGLAAETASRLAFVARSVGVEADELAIALDRLAKNMFSNTVEADKGKDAFAKWGIAIKDAHGNTRNINDILLDASSRVQAMGNSAASTALEMDLFGRSGGRLHELLMLGAEGIKELSRQSDLLGTTLSQANLNAFIQQSHQMDLALLALKVQLGMALLPILQVVVAALTGFVQWVRSAIFENRVFAGIIKAVADAFRGLSEHVKAIVDKYPGIKTVAAALAGLVVVIAGLAVAGGLVSLLGLLGRLALLGAPVLLVVGGLVAIGIALLNIKDPGDKAIATLGGLEAALSGVALAFALKGNLKVAIVIADVALVIDAVKETIATVRVLSDNWEIWRKAVHEGALQNQGDINDINRTFVRGLVLWGEDFSAFGTLIHDYFAPDGIVGRAFSGLGTFVNEIFGEGGKVGQAFSNFGTMVHEWFDPQGLAMPAIGAFFNLVGIKAQEAFGPGGTVGQAFDKFGTVIHDAIMLINIDLGWIKISGAHGIEFHIPTPTIRFNVEVPQMPSLPVLPRGTIFDLGKWLKENLPHAAVGAIVTRPTAMLLGESGPEAVMPLPLGRGGMGQITNVFYVSGNIAENERSLAERIADQIGDALVRTVAVNRNLSY